VLINTAVGNLLKVDLTGVCTSRYTMRTKQFVEAICLYNIYETDCFRRCKNHEIFKAYYSNLIMRKGGVAGTIALILLLIVLVIAVYFLYQYVLDLNATPISFVKNKTAEIKNQSSYSSQLQFYPNMRFAKKTITYNIDANCSDEKKTRTLQAFSRLEEETSLLNFLRSSEADILVNCEETQEEIPGKYFIAGEGGPTEITNASNFYIIEKGKILLLYKNSQCDNYNVELHELLHVLGFEHSENKNSIMYNTTSCQQILTNDIIDELKRLYSIQELPDLYFSSISATKHGSYLDFNVEVINSGLNEAENVKLEIYAEDEEEEKIDEFILENVGYGEGKSLEVKNLKISRAASKIKFVIVNGEDLDEKNNIIELFLPES